jgi:hypothetical protein
MKINAFLVGLGIAAATLMAAPTAHGYPGSYGTNCETNQLGVVFCDGIVQPDGTWVRCNPVPQSLNYQCWSHDPVSPPSLPLFQPNHHIDS